MSARHVLIVFASLLLALGACKKEEKGSADKAERAEKSEKAHAPSDVKPGSHDDWCEEHQVPESQCTRCDPDLIPAFQAADDWCEEHGLPESQCTICNPDLVITRPPEES